MLVLISDAALTQATTAVVHCRHGVLPQLLLLVPAPPVSTNGGRDGLVQVFLLLTGHHHGLGPVVQLTLPEHEVRLLQGALQPPHL